MLVKPMNLSKRERYIFIATVALITAVLAYNFIIKPFFKNWNRVNNEIVTKKIALRRNLKLLEARNAIIKEYNTYAASSKNMSKILSYIEREAGSLGIKTANIRPMPAVQKEFYEDYVIELQIEGTFSAINRFLSQLIKSPAVLTIKKFSLRSVAENPSFFKGTLILSKLII